MILKRLLLCGTLFASAFFPSFSFLNACGWSGEWENEFYRFMSPEMAQQEWYEPFQFTWDRLYSYDMLDPEFSEDANLKEWSEYFGSSIPEADIGQAVYKLSVADLQAAREKALGQRQVLGGKLSENALIRAWSKGKWPDALEYLIFAKQCEPYCLPGTGWDETPANARGSEPLIEQGVQALKKEKEDFLRMRYAYQVVRLLQYSGNSRDAVSRFEEYVAPLAHLDNTIYWWTESHYAGALRYSKRPAEAAYHFARVFDHCPTRRIQAYYSFRVTSDEQWAQAQSYCQNGREKATLHFLRAITPNALSTDEIREIQMHDPGSDLADVLLLREINKLEKSVLSYAFSSRRAFHEGRDLSNNEGVRSQIADLGQLIEETLEGGEMHDADLWKLAGVYLQFLAGDPDKAHSRLSEVRGNLGPAGELRASLLDLVFRIARTKKVDSRVENTLLKDLTNLGNKLPKGHEKRLREFMDEAMAWLYDAQGQPAKAFLARRKQYTTREQANLLLVNDLLKFEGKERKTLYERQLLERLQGSMSRDDLLELKATRLMAKNLLPEAIRIFKALPESYRQQADFFTLEADPFKGHLRDIVNCSQDRCGGGEYTKLSLAETLLSLQKKALMDSDNAGKYYHLLGNAYYNITYFGPAWRAVDYGRSGGSWWYLGRHEEWYQFDPETFEEFVDMTLAEKYYNKSAEASTDPELAALSTFMAAKCEQNRFYVSGSEDILPYRSNFRTLIRNYRNTEVYDELIRECFYFRSFASR